jgi:predicted TIM-barrel fold metal-dependent hydrolase
LAVSSVSDAVPDLRIVVDHLPKLEPTREEQTAYGAVLLELQKRPKVYTKLSAVIHEVDGKVSSRLADHKARLDHLSEIFGEDRILFGSDWPNSDGTGPVDEVVAIMKAYFAGKPRSQAEKYFWRNSMAAYGWKPRNPVQAALV